MNITKITVKDFDSDEGVTVTLMAVFGFDDFGIIYIADLDGRGLWFGCDFDWEVDVEEGDVYDAEVIGGVFGSGEEEWEAVENRKLAGYGFCLGAFDGEHGGGCFLTVL